MRTRMILKWLASFLQEDSGKGSIKRVLALVLTLVLSYVIIHYARNVQDYNWNTFMPFAGVLTGFIAALLALTYIPTRTKDSDQK